jgi:calcineurin-like phosphoesterase family protein
MNAYLEIFRKVVAYAEVAGWLLAHIPVHPSSIVPRFEGQIHGHTHGAAEPKVRGAARYSCVSVELTDFRPITIEEAIITCV